MKITHVRDLSPVIKIRSTCFLDEENMAAITPSGDVWNVSVESTHEKLLFTKEQILGPVAQSLGQSSVEPAKGGYPRLFISRQADWLIVNTHDFIFVACHLKAAHVIRLIAGNWGQYYPSLSFSEDGRWLLAVSDVVVVYDSRSWKWKILKGCSSASWWPGQSALLLVNDSGQLSRINVEDGASPTRVGSLANYDDLGNHIVGMCITGDGLVVLAYERGILEWWQLDPIQCVTRISVGDNKILVLTVSPERDYAICETEKGLRFYRLRDREQFGDLLSGYSNPVISPSGHRILAIEKRSSNPYPMEAGEFRPKITQWELSE